MTAPTDQEAEIEIADLRERPELAHEVAQIQYDQWGDFTDLSLGEMAELFRTDVAAGELPVTLIAVAGDRVVAIVSLRAVTMGAVKHSEVYIDGVSPWLSNMWVAEWARGRTLATRISLALEEVARDLGYRTIYSSTATEDSLYHKLGYRTIGKNPHHEYTVHLITKELG